MSEQSNGLLAFFAGCNMLDMRNMGDIDMKNIEISESWTFSIIHY
jgi:hypothetical protein